MPHSSGGGSHGGGCHSSSHSSHGGGHGSSGPRISRRPFANSRRFMYHDRYGSHHFIYSTVQPKPQSLAAIIIQLVFMIPFLIAGLVMSFMGFRSMQPPKPLVPHYSDSGIYIEDNAGVLEDTDQLEKTLKEFKKNTGICPYIITVNDPDWDSDYSSLENYAYSLYVNKFEDEQHFLVVYSEPENASDDDFVDWSWEGTQGDDTDPILTDTKFKKFQNDLQKYLTKDSVSVTDAFNKAFDNSLEYIMSEDRSNPEGLSIIGFAAAWFLFIMVFVISIIRGFIVSKRDYQEVPEGEIFESKEDIYQGPEIR